MKKFERSVLFYDLSIKTKSDSCGISKPIPVRKALELVSSVNRDEMRLDVLSGSGSLYISEVKWDNNVVCLLINKSDMTLSDPVFTNPEKNQRRTIKKIRGEGQDFSIHLVIKLPQTDIKPALVLIESCVGLSVSNIKKLLNHVISKAEIHHPEDFCLNHPDGSINSDGSPNKYKISYCFDLVGHLSNDLKYDLEHGKIDSIELITEQEIEFPFDEGGYVKQKSTSILLKPFQNKSSMFNWYGYIKDTLFPVVNEKYNKARIRFKNPAGCPRSISVSTIEDLANVYVKKEKIDNFELELQSSYERICQPIYSKMVDLIVEEEYD